MVPAASCPVFESETWGAGVDPHCLYPFFTFSVSNPFCGSIGTKQINARFICRPEVRVDSRGEKGEKGRRGVRLEIQICANRPFLVGGAAAGAACQGQLLSDLLCSLFLL